MFNVKSLKEDYWRCNTSTTTDIPTMLADSWCSFSDDGKGYSYFSVTPAMASLILHNCRFKIISEKKYQSIFHICKTFNEKGIKAMLPKDPIMIDTCTNTIIDGAIRLVALAMARKGTYLKIEFI